MCIFLLYLVGSNSLLFTIPLETSSAWSALLHFLLFGLFLIDLWAFFILDSSLFFLIYFFKYLFIYLFWLCRS